MIKRSAAAVLLALGLAAVARAEPVPRQFVLANTQIIPLQSKHTGRAHELVVVLPASYAADSQKTYPVLYFLDAYWDTPLLAATYGNLVYDNEVPEFIMVGLSYPNGADYDRERTLDYTFTATDDKSGKGKQFLAFLQTEVAPLIESRYHGGKTGRVLSGSSLGGLFALSALYAAPDFFDGYIAISPAALWDGGLLKKYDDAYAQTHKALKARVFISDGSAEHPVFRNPILSFQQQLAARKYQDLALMNYSMEGIDHASVKGDGYVRGLKWVWKDKKPAGPSGLARNFTR